MLEVTFCSALKPHMLSCLTLYFDIVLIKNYETMKMHGFTYFGYSILCAAPYFIHLHIDNPNKFGYFGCIPIVDLT